MNKPIVIICIQVIGIFWDLADGIEQRFGFIELLHHEITISLVKLHVCDLTVTEIGDAGSGIIFLCIAEIFLR
jgi:hypothetical protein